MKEILCKDLEKAMVNLNLSMDNNTQESGKVVKNMVKVIKSQGTDKRQENCGKKEKEL